MIASLVGGVYALRQVTAQKPAEVAVKPSESKTEDQKPQTGAQQQSAEEKGGEKSATDTPAVNEPVADQPEPAKEEPSQAAQSTPSGTQTELPRTGVNGAGSWVALGLLTGAGIAYARSRRFTLT